MQNILEQISQVLVLIGALNWGLIGVTQVLGTRFDLVEWLRFITNVPYLDSAVYILVGVAALYLAVSMLKG